MFSASYVRVFVRPIMGDDNKFEAPCVRAVHALVRAMHACTLPRESAKSKAKQSVKHGRASQRASSRAVRHCLRTQGTSYTNTNRPHTSLSWCQYITAGGGEHDEKDRMRRASSCVAAAACAAECYASVCSNRCALAHISFSPQNRLPHTTGMPPQPPSTTHTHTHMDCTTRSQRHQSRYQRMLCLSVFFSSCVSKCALCHVRLQRNGLWFR